MYGVCRLVFDARPTTLVLGWLPWSTARAGAAGVSQGEVKGSGPNSRSDA